MMTTIATVIGKNLPRIIDIKLRESNQSLKLKTTLQLWELGNLIVYMITPMAHLTVQIKMQWNMYRMIKMTQKKYWFNLRNKP